MSVEEHLNGVQIREFSRTFQLGKTWHDIASFVLMDRWLKYYLHMFTVQYGDCNLGSGVR